MTEPTTPSATARFIGWSLIVIGALMAVLCGGCTAIYLAIGVASLFHGGYEAGLPIVIALMFGILPTAAGVALVWAGWRVVKPPKPKTDPDSFN